MAFIGTSNVDQFDGSGVYATDFLKTLTHDRLTGSVYSNEAGDFYIDQSPDGIHWDITNFTASINTNAAIAVTGGTGNDLEGLGFDEKIILPFIRIRFVTTSEDDPTVFRLHARTSDSGVKY